MANPEKLSARREMILSGEPYRIIVSLSIPLLVSGSIQSLYHIVDTFWLSRLGSAQLGTPTVSWPYRGILMSLGFGLASSISALTGQYIGAGDYRRAGRVVGQVIAILMALGLPGTLILYLARNMYLSAAGVPGDVSGFADIYIAVTLAGIPFSYLFMVFNFTYGAAGDTLTPMKVSVAVTLLNFALDPLLIFWAGLGVLGAALATFIASMASGLYAVVSLATGRHGIKLCLEDLFPDASLLKTMMEVSLPVTVQRLSTTLGFLAMVPIISGLGTPVIAAYSIGQVVLDIDHIVSFPIIRSSGIVVAQNLGAFKLERAKAAVKTGLTMLTAVAASFIVFLVVGRSFFVSLFTHDPAVAAAAGRMLLIFGPSVLGFDIFMFVNSIARASGHTFLVSALGALRLWGLRVPLSWLLAYPMAMGDTGLWTGMSLSNWITGITSLAWLLSWRWLKPIIEK